MGESFPQEIGLSTDTPPEACLAVSRCGCPRLKVPFSPNAAVTPGCLDLRCRPTPVVQDRGNSCLPGVPWNFFQRRPPTAREIASQRRRFPDAAIAFVGSRDAQLLVLDVDPGHGGKNLCLRLGTEYAFLNCVTLRHGQSIPYQGESAGSKKYVPNPTDRFHRRASAVARSQRAGCSWFKIFIFTLG